MVNQDKRIRKRIKRKIYGVQTFLNIQVITEFFLFFDTKENSDKNKYIYTENLLINVGGRKGLYLYIIRKVNRFGNCRVMMSKCL